MVVVIADGGGEMAAGGEAEDADFVRVDVPVGGVEADEAEGALRVFEGHGGFGVRAGFGVGAYRCDSVFEEDAGDALGDKPVADFGAF